MASQRDGASAACAAVKLPGYCPANAAGQVKVTYTSAKRSPGRGSDTLTAAVDPYGTGQASDQYTYPAPGGKVTCYSWAPDPIAPAASLARGKAVTVTLTAVDAGGNPVPAAVVYVTLTQAPGSNATVSPSSSHACTSAGPRQLKCGTDQTGHVTLTYTSSTAKPKVGSDALGASSTAKPTTQTFDTYSYN